MRREDLMIVAHNYIKLNPERFDEREKNKFMYSLRSWMMGGSSSAIDDEVYDFLIAVGVLKEKTRHEQFESYLNRKYDFLRFKRVLDVGAGRMCHLSELLAKRGARVTAMDPNIRLYVPEIVQKGLTNFSRERFSCDEFAPIPGMGTDIENFDLIVGLEPCDATEHIIRQGLEYEKPFEIVLCGAPHDALNGKKFRSYEEWYKYLESISDEVFIKETESGYIATNNNPFMEMERSL